MWSKKLHMAQLKIISGFWTMTTDKLLRNKKVYISCQLQSSRASHSDVYLRSLGETSGDFLPTFLHGYEIKAWAEAWIRGYTSNTFQLFPGCPGRPWRISGRTRSALPGRLPSGWGSAGFLPDGSAPVYAADGNGVDCGYPEKGKSMIF